MNFIKKNIVEVHLYKNIIVQRQKAKAELVEDSPINPLLKIQGRKVEKREVFKLFDSFTRLDTLSHSGKKNISQPTRQLSRFTFRVQYQHAPSVNS